MTEGFYETMRSAYISGVQVKKKVAEKKKKRKTLLQKGRVSIGVLGPSVFEFIR